MTLSRRGFLVGLIASPAIVRFSSLMPVKLFDLTPVYGGSILTTRSIMEELTAVTRRAFVPSVYVQIYQASPLLNRLQGTT